MKTARSFACEQTSRSSRLACAGNDGGHHDHVCDLLFAAIEDRDRLHIAESKAREEEMQATIGRLGKEVIDLSEERDRLKGELAEARRLISAARNHLSSAADIIMDDGGDDADDRCEREFIQELALFLGPIKAHAFVSPARGGQGCIAIIDEKAGKTCGEWGEHPVHAAPSTGESPTFEQLVQRVGPLPTTQLAGAAESTGDMIQELGEVLDAAGARVYINRSPKGCVCPFPRDKCPKCENPCEECRKAAPPDDIWERLEQVESALHAMHRFSDATMKTAEGFERRLIILEDTARKRWIDVAEQIETSPSARHEFIPGPHPELCYFERSVGIICALTRQNPVHAPAAPQEQAGHAFNDYWRNGKCAFPDCGLPEGFHTKEGAKP